MGLRVVGSKLVRVAVAASVPWLPAYAFERVTFSLLLTRGDLYGVFSGLRIFVDITLFALGGILISYLLRPRFAMTLVSLNAILLYSLFYLACGTFFTSEGFLVSECYLAGPDGFAGYRLALLLFCLSALPVLVRVSSNQFALRRSLRIVSGFLAAVVVSVATVWFVMAAWFSGVLFLPQFVSLQVLMLLGVPGLAGGILAARILRSIFLTTVAGVVSAVFLSFSFWPLPCPGCDRSLLAVLVFSWGLFFLIGGLIELPRQARTSSIASIVLSKMPSFRRIAIAIAVSVSLSQLALGPFWDPSVLYSPSLTTEPGPQFLGLPAYRPYVAGYYDSVQYRICCVEVGVSFSRVNLSRIGEGNFLLAGMGVQSPNCCVDGWDFGWRADVVMLYNGTLLVTGDSWETCDGNANCGGHFWQNLRYHSQTWITPADPSSPIFLRMAWESGLVNWYYNYSGVPWQRYGSFAPNWMYNPYFDIGVVLGGFGNLPYQKAFFFQFGVASNEPVSGWTIALLYPSFRFQGEWRPMEKAAVIHGDHSYWKVNYRWGGAPYQGVSARANSIDPSIEKNRVEFSYTGETIVENTSLW